MGYAYQIIGRITPDVKEVAESLSTTWRESGLKVSEPEKHEDGGLKLTLSDPESGRFLPLHIAEYDALADGYWLTGTQVKVSPDKTTEGLRKIEFNEKARNKPRQRELEEAMQGQAKDDTQKVAESIRSYIKKGGPEFS